MRVGLLVLDVFLHGCQSLKEKRRALRSIIERAKARHNVAVAEVDHQDLHQRGTIAFVSVASAEAPLERLFDALIEDAERIVPGGINEVARDLLG